MKEKYQITTIGKLFDVEYGQKEYHNKEWLEGNEGKNILISSKGDDNGVYGFFNIETKYKKPAITVPGYGTIGQAFVQEYPCSVDDHLLILLPKVELSMNQLFQVAYQIRLDKWKYKYGRGITPTRIESQKIKLIDSKIKYKDFSGKITPKDVKKIKINKNANIKLIPVIYIKDKQENGLCLLNKKIAFPQNQLEDGSVPYVTTSSRNNGVSGYYDEDPNFKGKCLTVALNGSVGETFFQFDDFITSGDNAVLTLNGDYNPYLLFFIAAMIRNHQWRYNYYRKLSISKLEKMKIPMPFFKNDIDFNYIEKVVKNSYGFEEIEKFI